MRAKGIERRMGRWKRVAAALWPRYSEFLDLINQNAKMSQWIKTHGDSMKVLPDKASLFAHLSANVIGDEPIDYLEFGVMHGWSIRQWSGLNTHPDRKSTRLNSSHGY